jgi:hypothetical protein
LGFKINESEAVIVVALLGRHAIAKATGVVPALFAALRRLNTA